MKIHSARRTLPQLVKVCATFAAISVGTQASASDCLERLNALDQRLSYSGALIGDEDSTQVSGFLRQSRSLRESALVLLSQEKQDECTILATKAIRLAKKASNPSVFSAESLIGKSLTNEAGEELGEIENIMVDLDHGVVAYALVAFGGVLGLGEELVPVPFDKFSVNPDSDSLEVDVSRETLETAPRYVGEDQELLSRRKWATAVHLHYDQDPYWQKASRSTLPESSLTQSDDDATKQLSAQSEDKQAGKKVAGTPEKKSETASSLAGLFTILDTDQNGKISKPESRREFVVFKRFSELDHSQDGSLEKEEFMQIAQTNQLTKDGEALIPRAKDALPEEAWTGGKTQKEAKPTE